jgi:hypothetical protein
MNARARPTLIGFDAVKHAYTINLRPVPSVTQVLAGLDDFSDIPADVLEFARTRGQHVHEAMALLARDALDWSSLDPQLLPYVEGGRRFFDESGLTVVASELVVGSALYRVAGTLDLIGYWRGSECLIDFKVMTRYPHTVGPQTAGYRLLYSETYKTRAPTRRLGVLLMPNNYRVKPLDDKRDETIFLSALNIHHWSASHVA